MNRTLLIALLACGLFLSAGAAASTPSDSAFGQQDIDPDDVLMSVHIEESGDAVWTIEYRTRLETDEDEQAFAELKDDVEADPQPYADRFQERMDTTAASAENATGREMEISQMAVSAENRSLPQEYGVLTYRFRWSNFAAADGDRLFVGDAIDGLFLDEETGLLISWPDGYELIDASPEPTETRDGSVIYEGPSDFASGEPRVELAPSEAASPTDDGADADGSSAFGPGISTPILIALTAVVLIGAAAAAVVLMRRRDGDRETGNDGFDGGGGVSPAETSPEPPEEELLSNEEQVLRLIESEGGRMKQKAVAERLGWTDAKTSQVTKKLRESDDLDGFRLGRENVLSLPDEDEDVSE